MDKITLNDTVWKVLKVFFKHNRGVGRPSCYHPRLLLEGILWVLTTGAQWRYLPSFYPPRSVCHYWLQKWACSGLLDQVFTALVQHFESTGQIKLAKAFIDATFARSKGGLDKVGKTKVGKGSKLMAIVEQKGIPIALHLESANPHEVTLIQPTLDMRSTEKAPEKLIGDRAYDSDPHDHALKAQGLELIAPHRSTKKSKTQDGRKLKSYKRRWRVEQFFAHLQNFRRLVVRYEKKASNFLALILLASSILVLQKFGIK